MDINEDLISYSFLIARFCQFPKCFLKQCASTFHIYNLNARLVQARIYIMIL